MLCGTLSVSGRSPCETPQVTSHETFDVQRPRVETNKLMGEDDAESFKARTAIGARILDQPLELERSVQRCRIVEEKPRRTATTFAS
jgi:hypothetical protein